MIFKDILKKLDNNIVVKISLKNHYKGIIGYQFRKDYDNYYIENINRLNQTKKDILTQEKFKDFLFYFDKNTFYKNLNNKKIEETKEWIEYYIEDMIPESKNTKHKDKLQKRVLKYKKELKELQCNIFDLSIYTKHLEHTIKEFKNKRTLENEEIKLKLFLLNKLTKQYKKGSIITEFYNHNSNTRPDIIIFSNGKSIIFELKSKADNLLKLKKQVTDYSTFADEINIVIDKKHLKEYIEKHNYTNCNLFIFDNNKLFKKVKGKTNIPEKDKLFTFIWYKEIENLFLGVKGKTKITNENKKNIIKKKYNIHKLASKILQNRFKSYSDNIRKSPNFILKKENRNISPSTLTFNNL